MCTKELSSVQFQEDPLSDLHMKAHNKLRVPIQKCLTWPQIQPHLNPSINSATSNICTSLKNNSCFHPHSSSIQERRFASNRLICMQIEAINLPQKRRRLVSAQSIRRDCCKLSRRLHKETPSRRRYEASAQCDEPKRAHLRTIQVQQVLWIICRQRPEVMNHLTVYMYF